jgi:hypothetical protein
MGAQAGRRSSISSMANMMRRMPNVFAGAYFGATLTAVGLRNFISSSWPWPSGVRMVATSTWTPSSPTTRSAQRPRPSSCPPAPDQARQKSDCICEVVDNNADVVHPPDRHPTEYKAGSTEDYKVQKVSNLTYDTIDCRIAREYLTDVRKTLFCAHPAEYASERALVKTAIPCTLAHPISSGSEALTVKPFTPISLL